MTRLLILLSLLGVILGLNPTMNNALRNQVIIDFKNSILPVVSKYISHFKLSDVHENKGAMEYRIYDINIYVNTINPSQVGIQFLGGSTLRLTGNSLGMHGGAKVYGRLLFIQQTVGLSIVVNGVGFSIDVVLKSVNNRPNIAISSFRISMSGNNVHITISGGFIAKLIELVVNILKGHVVSEVVRGVQSSVPPLVTKLVNEKLNQLPLDIKITDQIYMRYGFSFAPVIRSGYLFTKIVAYFYPKNNPSPPPGPIKNLPEIDNKAGRNAQFFVSDFIVRSALNTAYTLRVLYLDLDRMIDNHRVRMRCAVDRLPEFLFNKVIEVRGEATCDVSLDSDPNPKFKMMATVYLRLSEKIKNAVVFFGGEKLEFTKLDFRTLKEVDITWFKNAINKVIAAILAVLNGELGQKGIPLPVIKEVDYSDVMQYVGDGYTMVGTTPKFHFTMNNEQPEPLFDYSSQTVTYSDDAIEE